MKMLYTIAMLCAIGNASYAWDGAINSTVMGWIVAALMFAAAAGREWIDG